MAALVITLGLVGCGDDEGSDGAADVGTDVTQDDSGATADDTTGMSEDEEAEVEQGAGGSVEIPEEIPLPEEHEILQAIGNPDAGFTIMMTTPMPASDVVDFYETELPDAGWESAETRSMGSDVMMVEAGRPDSDHSFAAQIASQDGETSVQIFTGPPG